MPRHPQRDSAFVRTKIVCTLGPSSSDKEVIRRMILAGADVFRLNFSHGTHEDHLTRIRTIRELGYEMGRPFAILGDLCGPKLRLGMIEGGETTIVEGEDLIVLTSNAADGTGKRFNVNFAGFHEVAKTGESIVLDDGRFHVLVVAVIKGTRRASVRVVKGGLLKSRKGVNLPDTKLPIPALTEKDKAWTSAFALAQRRGRAGAELRALARRSSRWPARP
jgi:pyruvate kinase